MKKKNILFIVLIFLLSFLRAENDLFKKSILEFYFDNDFTFATKIDIPILQIKTSFQEKNTNYGINIFSKNLIRTFPCSLKCGNLSVGGSFSKLNNLAINSISSGFSTGFLKAKKISASLPSFTSFSKPFSFFGEFGYQSKKMDFFLNFYCLPKSKTKLLNPDFMFSFLGDFKQLFNHKVEFSVTGGNFNYDEKNSSSWFLREKHYKEGNHFGFLPQILIEKENAIFTFSSGIYQNQFGDFLPTFRSDFKVSFKRLLISSSSYMNFFEDVFTTSNKKIEKSFQFLLNIQQNSIFKNQHSFLIKNGISSFVNIEEKNKELILVGNSRISNNRFSTGIVLLGKWNDDLCFSQFKINLLNTFYFDFFKPSFKISGVFSPNKQENSVNSKYDFQIKLNFQKISKIYLTESFSFKTDYKEITNKKSSTSVNLRLKLKSLIITGKIKFDVDL